MEERPTVSNTSEDNRKTLKESHTRSILKGITWRILGTLDTMVISWFLTGNIKIAAAIGGTEVFTKIVLFYLHERAWQLVPRGAIREKLKTP